MADNLEHTFKQGEVGKILQFTLEDADGFLSLDSPIRQGLHVRSLERPPHCAASLALLATLVVRTSGILSVGRFPETLRPFPRVLTRDHS